MDGKLKFFNRRTVVHILSELIVSTSSWEILFLEQKYKFQFSLLFVSFWCWILTRVWVRFSSVFLLDFYSAVFFIPSKSSLFVDVGLSERCESRHKISPSHHHQSPYVYVYLRRSEKSDTIIVRLCPSKGGKRGNEWISVDAADRSSNVDFELFHVLTFFTFFFYFNLLPLLTRTWTVNTSHHSSQGHVAEFSVARWPTEVDSSTEHNGKVRETDFIDWR